MNVCITILWNQRYADREDMATRPYKMIKNNEEKTRILVDVAIIVDRSAQNKEAEEKLEFVELEPIYSLQKTDVRHT